MGRTASVTYEQVKAIANTLYAEGNKNPGAKAIREALAARVAPGEPVGSPNTIQRHLMAWRERDRPVEHVEPPVLPAQLAADISRALQAASEVGREEVQQQLEQLRAELVEAVTVGEAAETQITDLEEELAERTAERDALADQLAERARVADELQVSLSSLTEQAKTLDQQMHAAVAQALAAEGRMDEIRQSTDRQVHQLRLDVDQARADAADAQQRAIFAEKDAAEARAHLSSERTSRDSLAEAHADIQQQLRALEGATTRAAAAEARAEGLVQQLALHGETIAMLRALIPPPPAPPAPAPPAPPTEAASPA